MKLKHNDFMICKECKKERKETDFLLRSDICYKCVYKNKKKLSKKNNRCKVCKKFLPPGRWSYCSNECSRIAKNRHVYWTAALKTDGFKWKNQSSYFRQIPKV